MTGRVVRPDGSPAEAVSVRIVRTDTGFSFRSDYRVVAETRTGPGGGYEGVLPGAYVRGTETDAGWIVTASLPAGTGEAAGASSSFEFEVNTAVQEARPCPSGTWPPRCGSRAGAPR